MYATIKTLSVLAIASSALAAPQVDAPSKVARRDAWGGWSGNWGGRGGNGGTPASTWTNWAATETVYVTGNAPAPTPEAAVETPAPAAETTAPAAGQFYNMPQGPPPSPAAAAPSSDWAAPAAAASSAVAAAVPASDGSWEGVVATWRAAGGLKALSIDSQLTANAQKTADESVGGLKHQLNSGSMAQVLAPGEANDFEHVYVGGWLCEIPSLPGLNGICSEQSKGWSYEGQTGHAEILTSGSYSKIGCAHSSGTGVWSCDLA